MPVERISSADMEALKYAIDSGIIDVALVQEKIDMKKREEILKKHPYKIWEGKNGKWYTYLPDKEKGRILKKKSTQKEIESTVVEYWNKELENPTISEVFSEWNDRKLDIGKISAATHLRNRQIFNRHYKEFGTKRIKKVGSHEWQDFLEEQIAEYELTAKAFSNLKSITRGFLKRAKRRELVDINVEEIFSEMDFSDTDFKIVQKQDYEEVFMEDELPVMLNYLTKNPDIQNLGILLMFVTGIRVGELVALKYSDFLDVGYTFRVNRTETRYIGEDGKYICGIRETAKKPAGVRTVIIPEDYRWIYKELRKCNPFGEYAFMRNGERLTAQAIRMRMRRLCKKLGIYHKSPHKARKTYASILLDNHVDNNMIIGQMGHTNILCTEKHYHRNRKDMNHKAEVINQIPEFLVK